MRPTMTTIWHELAAAEAMKSVAQRPPSTTTTTTATAGGGGPTSILLPRSGASVDEVGDCCTATMPTVHEQHESNGGGDDGRLANGAVAKGFWRTFSF